MTDEAYDQLAEALGRLPNGFARTTSGVEISILKRIFTPTETALAGGLTLNKESPTAIAGRLRRDIGETERILVDMADRDLVWSYEMDGKTVFRLAPFVVGIYEAQLGIMDHEFAHMIEQFLDEGGAVGMMRPQPALHRIVPAQKAVKSEWIMPYDDVRMLLMQSKTFRLRDCICRVQQDHIGRKCDFPIRSCLSFATEEQLPNKNGISQKEALEFLDDAERIGLIHSVSNVAKGVNYVCNCCGCCCGIVRAINDWGIEKSVAASNYYAVIDPGECLGCLTCVDRCQVKAITEVDGHAVVNREKCIGCGLCVTGCANEVARLERKPASETVEPPADFAAWEVERLRNRGIA